jgi:hypothetical protein
MWSFVIFFPIMYVWTKKNLATLHRSVPRSVPEQMFALTKDRQLHQTVHLLAGSDPILRSLVRYNGSVVKNYNTVTIVARFGNKNAFSYLEKRSSLL